MTPAPPLPPLAAPLGPAVPIQPFQLPSQHPEPFPVPVVLASSEPMNHGSRRQWKVGVSYKGFSGDRRGKI